MKRGSFLRQHLSSSSSLRVLRSNQQLPLLRLEYHHPPSSTARLEECCQYRMRCMTTAVRRWLGHNCFGPISPSGFMLDLHIGLESIYKQHRTIIFHSVIHSLTHYEHVCMPIPVQNNYRNRDQKQF